MKWVGLGLTRPPVTTPLVCQHKRVHLVIKKKWILIYPQPGQFLTNFKNLKFHIFIEIYIFLC